MALRQSVGMLFVLAMTVVLFVSIFYFGGFTVRGLIASSFRGAENVRATRALVLQTLKLQLDEETGVRGYAATHDPVFLEPYHRARTEMPPALGRLRSAIDNSGSNNDAGLSSARSNVAAAEKINDRWLRMVAEPLVKRTAADARLTQRIGKTLVDRFRADVAATDRELAQREATIDAAAQAAIDRISLLVTTSAATLLGLATIFTALQLRAMRRLEVQRQQAEEDRRLAAGLRSAYLAEKRIADTLQDAFSQRPLPTVPTLRFSATYVPATQEARVGGDWYDAIELPGNRVLFAIGDVTGHGLDAAVAMSRARQSLIAAALANAEPASILHRVNLDLIRQGSPLVTAVVGYAAADSHEFLYSIAGHPPPVLLEPGQPARLLECGALPLGTLAEATYQTYRVQAGPDAFLVLYTDGAVEHSRDVLDGEMLLLQAASLALETGADDPANVIYDAIFKRANAGDDVAILTIGFAAERAAGFTVSASHASADFAGYMGGIAPAPATGVLVESNLRHVRRRWTHPEALAS